MTGERETNGWRFPKATPTVLVRGPYDPGRFDEQDRIEFFSHLGVVIEAESDWPMLTVPIDLLAEFLRRNGYEVTRKESDR